MKYYYYLKQKSLVQCKLSHPFNAFLLNESITVFKTISLTSKF